MFDGTSSRIASNKGFLWRKISKRSTTKLIVENDNILQGLTGINIVIIWWLCCAGVVDSTWDTLQ